MPKLKTDTQSCQMAVTGCFSLLADNPIVTTGSDFSGVGAFDQALERLGIKQNKKFACDMDKYARQTYIYNFGEPDYYPENVYEREIPKESLDIYMTSPPCQSFSLAGKRKGEDSKNGVLFYNSHEFIVKNNPRYFIFENVKGLLSDDNGKTFQRWIDYLGGKSVNGNPVIFPHENATPYHVYYQVMNAKHYGVPQNRERIFIIGIRDDADNTFSFPKPFHLVKRLKDVLESEVDEKYFLSDTMLTWIDKYREKRSSSGKYPFTEDDDYSGCITARYNKMGAEDIFIGAIRGRNPQNPLSRVSGLPTEQMLEINENGTSNALTTVQKDNVVIIPANNSKGYDIAQEEEDSINFSNPNSETIRGRVGKGVAQTLDISCNQGVLVSIPNPIVEYQLTGGKWDKTHEQSGRVYDKNGIAPTIHTMGGGNQEPKVSNMQRIRRLTPFECFRLMDFNENFKWNVSDSQAYKQAGNSIVVSCLVEIIKRLDLHQPK
ncbi:DNA cytosine methyltransferase [Flavobacterium sp.]|uniref:DNA cytosine methyltransferase n=1 Tax=Flavobacterium sp. TaxID=239 RepID=UPI0026119A0F|nr:DNA (cytosine-5-)-methyltransferase [Flavobacterium sp.]